MNLFVAQYSAQIRNIRVPENMVRILEIIFRCLLSFKSNYCLVITELNDIDPAAGKMIQL